MTNRDEWFEGDDAAETESIGITEYDIISSPNDFNVMTLFDFLESGVVKVPAFQRNFVWDQRRASKLIESLIMGLPVPQIFLYEEAKNSFLVIDGQQRLLSIYYFLKGRFPKLGKRVALRRRLVEGRLNQTNSLLLDNEFFTGFKLSFPEEPGVPPNPLDGRDCDSLGDLRNQLNLRTMRVVIVKQASPEGLNSIYEIFNRLNTQGVNLAPQEIRMSLFHSPFMDMLARVNFDARWRRMIGLQEADLHLRDVEFLLRGLALMEGRSSYSPSMVGFLNGFAAKARQFTDRDVECYETLLSAFFDACGHLGPAAFHGQSGKFTVSIFDAVFAAVTEDAFRADSRDLASINPAKLKQLKRDPEFVEATLSRTTGSGNVKTRIDRARYHLGS